MTSYAYYFLLWFLGVLHGCFVSPALPSVGGWQQEQAAALGHACLSVVGIAVVRAVCWFYKVRLSAVRIFLLCLTLLPIWETSGEYSSQDMQQKLCFGHTEAVTVPGSRLRLNRHEAAPVRTFYRGAGVRVCTGFPKRTRAPAPAPRGACSRVSLCMGESKKGALVLAAADHDPTQSLSAGKT